MSSFAEYNCASGRGIKQYLETNGVSIEGCYDLDGAGNYIKLVDLTTFNWKAKKEQIRINCKRELMQAIEYKLGIEHIDNGAGDPVRPYSFLLNSFEDFQKVVEVVKMMQ